MRTKITKNHFGQCSLMKFVGGFFTTVQVELLINFLYMI